MRQSHKIIAVLATAAVAVAGCGSSGTGTDSRTTASTRPAPLGAGFYDSASPPPPEGTVTPSAGSWATTHPPAGYRVVLITAGTDAPTHTIVAAVRRWSATEDVALTVLTATTTARLVPTITAAMRRKPDLIISAGSQLVDPLATVTASALDQQFLIIGAELAEPTGNVTAADWTGASYRGEGLGTPSSFDASTFTPDRAARAIRAGVAAVLNRLTGIVVWMS